MGDPMRGKRTDPEAAQRAAKAMQLRILGFTFDTIAKQCGFTNRGSAYNAVKRELQRTVRQPADELRTLEVERLDALLTAFMPKALKGDSWSCRRVLDIMERRSLLLGLDAPKDVRLAGQVDVSIVPQGQVRKIAVEMLDAVREMPDARAALSRRLLASGE